MNVTLQRVKRPAGLSLFRSSFGVLGSGRNANFRMVYGHRSIKYGRDWILTKEICEYREGGIDDSVDLLVVSHAHLTDNNGR